MSCEQGYRKLALAIIGRSIKDERILYDLGLCDRDGNLINQDVLPKLSSHDLTQAIPDMLSAPEFNRSEWAAQIVDIWGLSLSEILKAIEEL